MSSQEHAAEAAWLQAAKKGDLAAFNRLVLMYQEQVYNVAYRLLGDPDEAADATQETFLKAYERLHQHRGGAFRAWLLRIATNTCYDILRKRQRESTKSLSDVLSAQDAAEDHALFWQSPGDSPEDLALRREVHRAVQEGLLHLPPEYRVAVVLSDIEGLSYEEIAHVLGIPLGTVKSRLSRGRAMLRDYLRTHHGELLPRSYRLKGAPTGERDLPRQDREGQS